jgi:hypothetical protein
VSEADDQRKNAGAEEFEDIGAGKGPCRPRAVETSLVYHSWGLEGGLMLMAFAAKFASTRPKAPTFNGDSTTSRM